MECEEARLSYVESLVGGREPAEGVTRHLSVCEGCWRDTESLAATWAVLAELPDSEPSPAIARRLGRRVGRESVRETLASLERWQQAALAGLVGFVLSVLLGLAVPYEVMIATCRAIAPAAVPTPLAYLMAGLMYGLVPMAVSVALQPRRASIPGVLGAVEAPLVFLVALAPYVILRCAEFPLALLSGFLGGIAAGAVLGGGAGAWLGRHHAWA